MTMSKGRRLILNDDVVISKIYLVRNCKVMLDRDLAALYGVTTGNLNKAVKRNLSRFPKDFMFRLAEREYKNLIFQIGISSWGGTRMLPYAFTEQGVAMLSSVLKSNKAIAVNIHIIRVFTKMRQLMFSHKEILKRLEQVGKKVMKHDSRLKKHEKEMQMIFKALKELLSPRGNPMRRIGFIRREEADEGV